MGNQGALLNWLVPLNYYLRWSIDHALNAEAPLNLKNVLSLIGASLWTPCHGFAGLEVHRGSSGVMRAEEPWNSKTNKTKQDSEIEDIYHGINKGSARCGISGSIQNWDTDPTMLWVETSRIA